MRAWISVFGTFFVLYHAYLFLYYLFYYYHVNAVFIALVFSFLLIWCFLCFLCCLLWRWQNPVWCFLMCICEMLQRRLPQMCLQRCAALCWRVVSGLQVLCGGCGKGRFSVVSRYTRCSVTTSSPLQFQQPFWPSHLAVLISCLSGWLEHSPLTEPNARDTFLTFRVQRGCSLSSFSFYFQCKRQK